MNYKLVFRGRRYKLKMTLAIQAFSILVLIAYVPEIMGDAGTIFLVVFTKEFATVTINLRVTLYGQEGAAITVKAPKRTNLLDERFVLGDGEPDARNTLVDNYFVAYESKKYSDIGVVVNSTSAITVLVFTDLMQNGVGACLYEALPLEQTSTFYTAVTSCIKNECVIMVASHYDDTRVQVRVAARTINSSDTSTGMTYKGTWRPHGTVFEEKLQAFEAFQLLAMTTDMSGTLISSDKPVVVLSGGVFERAYNSYKKDKVQEQMPPIKGLGHTYVLRGVPYPSEQRYPAFILTPYPDTQIEFPNTQIELIRSSTERQLFKLRANETIVVTSSKPVLIVFGLPETDQAVDQEIVLDSSLVLAMPINTWKTAFVSNLFITQGNNLNNRGVIVTASGCQSQFAVNGIEMNNMSWTIAGEYKSGSVELPIVEQRIVIENPDCLFGGYILGSTGYKTWAYTFGWDAQILNGSEPGPDLLNFPPSPVMSASLTTAISSENVPTSTVEPAISSSPIDSSIIYAGYTTSQLTTSLSTGNASLNSDEDALSTSISLSQLQTIMDVTATTSSSIEHSSTQVIATPQNNVSVSPSQVPAGNPAVASHEKSFSLRLCPCECLMNMDWVANLTNEEKQEQIRAIVRELQVDKSTVSKTIRRKTSAKNKKPASAYYGSTITVFVFLSVCGVTVMPDVINVIHFLGATLKRMK